MRQKTKKWEVQEDRNYKRISHGDVLTGHQVNYLMEMANFAMRAIILLDLVETEETPNVKGL